MNTAQTILSISGALVIGLVTGYMARPPQDIDCTQCPPPCPVSQDISTISNLSQAHSYSNNYRKQMGYCPTAADPFGHPKEGYFEITKAQLVALNTAVDEIGKQQPTSSRIFRCIFSLENATDVKSKLLVVGLDNSTRKENTSLIYKVNLGLDCPVLCDAPLSEIIFGANGKDACK